MNTIRRSVLLWRVLLIHAGGVRVPARFGQDYVRFELRGVRCGLPTTRQRQVSIPRQSRGFQV
jgi:hypothetical protein